jgi:hypothetical protein
MRERKATVSTAALGLPTTKISRIAKRRRRPAATPTAGVVHSDDSVNYENGLIFPIVLRAARLADSR